MHLIIDISIRVQSVRISIKERVRRISLSDFSTIKAMRHIHSLVIMRSLDTLEYTDKRVSIKSEVVENSELKYKAKNELVTNTLGACTFIPTCMQASYHPQGQ